MDINFIDEFSEAFFFEKDFEVLWNARRLPLFLKEISRIALLLLSYLLTLYSG